ncbi:hypothetical protein JOB18_027813 [Solea senegalensis]|uniref:Rab-GAP TBC domain-containing protein n=1 Tax=Solea senegalensis TaxID=28829 RepID=A0AAV6R9X2_SOLSE|nr:hypothetical protein JOB18_027813 [Solea senegalensis]
MEEEEAGGAGGSTTFDFNDNEEEERRGGGGGGGVKAGLRVSISSALLAGVSGGQGAGKGHFCVSANRRKFTGEEMNLFPDHVITPAQCVVPEVLDDHCGLNGFCEPLCQEEEVMRGGGAGRLRLAETTATSCPAVLQGWWKVQGDETKEQQHCACTVATVAPSAGTLTNGVVVSEDSTYSRPAAGVSSPALQGHVNCGRVEVANGGLHSITSDCHVDVTPGHKTGDGTAMCQCPGQDELPPCPTSSNTAPIQDQEDCPPTPGSSAKLPSPCSSSSSNPDSPLSGADSAEDEAELSLPIRPQSLRTNPAPLLSLSCDATPLTPNEDGGFYFGDMGYGEDCRNVLEMTGRRQSAPDKLPDPSEHADASDPKLLPKRFGIADFFTRSLFSRKPKEPKTPTHNAMGWRMFGKVVARDADSATDSASMSPTHKDEQMKDSDVSSCSQQLPLAAGRRKKLEFEPLSTTALILEDRPSNLPAKSEEETQRHKLEYEEMVAGAKKRELKEAQKKKRQMKERHRQEDNISNAMIIWNNDILPHWDAVKGTRRVRELWWQGLPPSVRGRVWSLAIGNELNITPELYEIFLSRAKEKWRSYSETSSVNDSESDGGASLADRESSLDLIKLDISRTFPSLFIFQKGGPYHDLLHSVLGAYTCYRPDIGYVS